MTLWEPTPQGKESSNEFVSYHEWEVAIFPADVARDVSERLIPESDFSDLTDGRKRTFTAPDLPFTLELSHYLRHSRAMPKGPMWEAETPIVDGYGLDALPQEKENEQNVGGLYLAVTDKAGKRHEGLLWGFARTPLTLTIDGRPWAIDLRKKRFSVPFTIVLDDFTRELHPRTNMPKVFMSDVTKLEDGVATQHKIEMNEPLRHAGYTLFQASWGPGDARPGDRLFSTFAVVKNPSDYWPLYSCIVITVGLLLTFGQKLTAYIRSQAPKRKGQA